MAQSASPGSRSASTKKTLLAVVVVLIVLVVIGATAATMLNKPKASSGNIYFYTWWGPTSGKALQNLTTAFHQAYPQYTAVPTVSPGAGGTNAKYAILTLIKAGSPPNTFQTHYGPEMLSYVEAAPAGASDFVNMTSYVKQSLFSTSVMPVLEAGAFNGVSFSLPVTAHQGAQLFFNPQVLKQYNLPIPNNITVLLNDTIVLGSHGVMAWVLPGGDGGWDQLNLWENTFLAYGGGTMYDQLMYGTLNINTPAVQHVLNETNSAFFTFVKYSVPGLESTSWLQDLHYVLNGNAAFYTSGNWVLEYTTDYLHVIGYPATSPYTGWTNITLMDQSFPSTQQYWVLVTDSVAVPSGPSSTNGLLFAKYFSSYRGDTIFTKTKAVTFYNNVTTDYYATPAQWHSYQTLVSTNSSKFLYQLSDGGLFDNVFASITSGMTALSEIGSSDLAAWNLTLSSAISSEYSQWQAANSLGYGYMGFPGHPFGGFVPPWATATAAGITAHHSTSKPVSSTPKSLMSKTVIHHTVIVSFASLNFLQHYLVGAVFTPRTN
jgi:glucose/arabinose transport system substrate-binding protein